MADILSFGERRSPVDNLIAAHPIEFRRADWHGGYAILCTKRESATFEEHRAEALRVHGHQHVSTVPNHFTLDDGCHYTLAGLYRHREDEALMRRVYRLAGLMETVTNAASPVLRTDLLRRVYQNILEEREALGVAWRGHVQHFLFPMHPDFRNPNLFFHAVANAETLKDLFDAIREETDAQFDVLSRHYVVYLPENFG